jgi:cellobiose phosphorylase
MTRKTAGKMLFSWMGRLGGGVLATGNVANEPPLRAELLSADQMKQHGQSLASAHVLARRWAPDRLLSRLADNEKVLIEACRLLTAALEADRRIDPAGEWLLDNFYLVEEQIRTARRHLPKDYSRELPRLRSGPSANLPRVYDIALEAISHGDGRVDPESLEGFVAAYQTVTPLTLGELWAVPIMLRLALIENLRRVSARVAAARIERDHAATWAEQMAAVAQEDPKSLILVTADMARANPPMVGSFVAELAHRLQGLSLTLPLTWIEQRLSESNTTIERMVHAENQQQAADQVSISNSIGSLRILGATDWRKFVESVSAVEQILREDPVDVYRGMAFVTRDSYRRTVEHIARRSSLTESEVARQAILLAQASQAGTASRPSGAGDDERGRHVGFYLIDQGLPQLERVAKMRSSMTWGLREPGGRFPFFIYAGCIALLAAIGTIALVAQVQGDGGPRWLLALTGILALVCTSQLAVALVDWLATLLATPHVLPRMDYSEGIPPESRTLVVVPTMLSSAAAITDLIEGLEVRYLANQDENLRFGLLTDLLDASTETLPEDDALVALAKQEIEALNAKYASPPGSAKGSPFLLFHRPRRFNPGERIWMGYERKRGKLAALNAFLRHGQAQTDFALVVGNTEGLAQIQYVITLDTDTQLPRDSARQMVGTLAHPLNRAIFDKRTQRVSAGYGILQPRMAESLAGVRSRYAQLWGSEQGLDPYTRAISDVYQDLFQEGSFIGKGIYDVDAFERALASRFPENRILSHDLVEGCYARSGLITDVQLYEVYPSRYSADVVRRQRWIRGDWQIALWTLPWVRAPRTGWQRNPLPMLARWKILDNLRRSLVPVAETLLLLLGWTSQARPWLWTLAVLGVFLVSPLVASIVDVLRKPKDVLLVQHLTGCGRSAALRFAQVGFSFACLPYEAFFSLLAILRTLFRMFLSHRRLLEWNLAGTHHGLHSDLSASFRTMWLAPALSVTTFFLLAHVRPAALAIAAPILALWFVGPALAWWSSRPAVRHASKLTVDDARFLRGVARKTWAFFDTFVGPVDHWLPPDNVQEHPAEIIAHRTSPTNMGLSLLANLAAHNFGFISTGRLVERTAHALHTMKSLQRHRGHFFNWYDTQSLQPLLPHYVSSVDSGNLAGHLLTLQQGLLALADEKIVGANLFVGLGDALTLAAEAADRPDLREIIDVKKALSLAMDARPRTLVAARRSIESITAAAELLAAHPGEAKVWAQALVEQCQDATADLAFIAPWTSLPEAPALVDRIPALEGIPTLRELASLADGGQRATKRIAVLERLAQAAGDLARMEYGFLFDKTRHLLAIGYNVDDRRCDASFYDLLASEARLATFVAIAQGQLPQESWFALGRRLTSEGGKPILLSWSGSMFEYLMPALVMPTYEGTLLDQTCRTAVERQIEYGAQRGVPWGMSESGYNLVDAHLNYQYRAFGVPGLGLKRGLAEDLVVAPYASLLALMVAPEEACRNLRWLTAEGCAGRYGFFEAIDYTPSRLPRGQSSALVQSFMAHHQGMGFLSLAYLLLDRPMQKYFGADRTFQATTLLLQERVPRAVAPYLHTSELAQSRTTTGGAETPVRIFDTPHTQSPEVQLLSNGRYHVMVTNAGGGYSQWKDLAVTRWREDSTRDHWGTFCYIRDAARGTFWSTAYQPALKRSDSYEAIFSESRAEFRCRKHDLDTHTEIAVSPEDDIELRRITITNRARKRRTIDLTSYAEVVLATPAADAQHPGFSNLFVQSEILRQRQAILCTRRPRSAGEASPWMFHLMAVHGAEAGEISYETDRAQFIGRGRTVADPQAMSSGAKLSDSQGSVLDPIVAIRQRITLEPNASATINIVTGVGETREVCLGLVDKYQDRRLADRVFDLAWTHSQVALHQINASEAEAQLYGALASAILYANASLRADPNVVKNNRRGQSGLWGYSISGDLPIVLLKIRESGGAELVRQLVQAHAYWRRRGLKVDLVIWNEDHSGYRQVLNDEIMALIAAGGETNVTDRPGGIFVRPADQIADEDRILVQTVARVVLSDLLGDLTDQLGLRSLGSRILPPPLAIRGQRVKPAALSAPVAGPRTDLILWNGIGGFTPDGREYVITTQPGRPTPAPWANVLANPQFGTVLSESGSAYTWSENAHEFRLTPWNNDPVGDTSGEALYLRDEESGRFWCPTSLPSQGPADQPTVTRHGFGYSVFEHHEGGIHTDLQVYVDVNAPVKFSVLKVRNDSGRLRHLSATAYVEWVLGDDRAKTAPHVVTNADPGTGALFARNPYSMEFSDRVAFLDTDDRTGTVTGDRAEFLGRNGTMQNPAALARQRLSGKLGATLDPCAAIQVPFELYPGQTREIIFRLGVGRTMDDAVGLVHRHRGSEAARTALEMVWQYWNHTLGAVQVETPDPTLDVLANGWLVYQTLACRLWARSGSYQSGGAFGFRDQLQDAMALIHCEPRLLREQLLLCAAHQFQEGDVQHWWHPPTGRGVRTHISDDYLWLPLAACRYVLGTGDTGVLDEVIPFIQGRPVGAEEDSYYDLPRRSAEADTLYAHCTRAILHGLRFGDHGLPLMGSGDWNDGMNCVGAQGKGESVWLGFFLYDVLECFTKLARRRGDMAFAERCQSEAAKVQRNIEESGWDGAWYRRAYFDDGSPLGSVSSLECQIDSIAQSWSVLSGAGDPARSRQAMDALDKRLVRRDDGIIQLLDPPFDKSDVDPGYIKGYVPGVRENGGQYTHAAIWAAMAFAAQGDAKRAWELLAMINPVNHGKSPEAIQIYKVEPYVVAADVYAVAPHIGRGGWTWYTGSAGWLYRLMVESLLGLRLDVDKLHITPCLPPDWQAFTVHYRHRETVYHIQAKRSASDGKMTVVVDGIEQQDPVIPLSDDRREHTVEVRIVRDRQPVTG